MFVWLSVIDDVAFVLCCVVLGFCVCSPAILSKFCFVECFQEDVKQVEENCTHLEEKLQALLRRQEALAPQVPHHLCFVHTCMF